MLKIGTNTNNNKFNLNSIKLIQMPLRKLEISFVSDKLKIRTNKIWNLSNNKE